MSVEKWKRGVALLGVIGLVSVAQANGKLGPAPAAAAAAACNSNCSSGWSAGAEVNIADEDSHVGYNEYADAPVNWGKYHTFADAYLGYDACSSDGSACVSFEAYFDENVTDLEDGFSASHQRINAANVTLNMGKLAVIVGRSMIVGLDGEIAVNTIKSTFTTPEMFKMNLDVNDGATVRFSPSNNMSFSAFYGAEGWQAPHFYNSYDAWSVDGSFKFGSFNLKARYTNDTEHDVKDTEAGVAFEGGKFELGAFYSKAEIAVGAETKVYKLLAGTTFGKIGLHARYVWDADDTDINQTTLRLAYDLPFKSHNAQVHIEYNLDNEILSDAVEAVEEVAADAEGAGGVAAVAGADAVYTDYKAIFVGASFQF